MHSTTLTDTFTTETQKGGNGGGTFQEAALPTTRGKMASKTQGMTSIYTIVHLTNFCPTTSVRSEPVMYAAPTMYPLEEDGLPWK